MQIKQAAAQDAALAKNPGVLSRQQQAMLRTKAERIGHWSIQRSDAQAMTAFGAAGADHGTTALGAHTDEKAVGTLAAHDGRLVGTFHGMPRRLRNARLYSFRNTM